MRTPSDHQDWSAKETGPRRSIFQNYARAAPESAPDTPCATEALSGSETHGLALARSFLYRYLALLFEYPTSESWAHLTDAGQLHALASAAFTLDEDPISSSVATLREAFAACDFDAFHDRYVSAFGHAARGSIPMNEIEFGEPRADALYQPHRLADLAAFYHAFGLSVAGDAGERQDHLCLQLEFLSVLAAKEAWALQDESRAEALQTTREGARSFLREHLGRWTPAFSRLVSARADSDPLSASATLLRQFVESDCARYGVTAGPDTLIIRAPDEAAERLCDGCGLRQPPPGALPEDEAAAQES